jgi:hypothetical protein
MPTHFTVSIPVKRYIKKYLMSRYGQLLIAQASTPFGDIVLTKLQDTKATKLSFSDRNIRLKTFNDVMKVRVPYDYFYSIGKRGVSDHSVIKINCFFENQFKELLYDYVKNALSFGSDIKSAIEKFADQYNIEIEHDITFECLKKMEYRCRKAVEAICAGNDLRNIPYDITTLSNLYRRSVINTDPSQLTLFK